MKHDSGTVLLADIGATNARFALAQGGEIERDSLRRYENAGFSDIQGPLGAFLAETGAERFDAACLAVAGPVSKGRAYLGNLGWTLDESDLSAALGGAPVRLVNDLTAQAYALDRLPREAFAPVKPGQRNDTGTRLVIGVGTGFNCAPLYRAGGGPFVPPAETGHMRFAPPSPFARRLADAIKATEGACVIERLISGRGIVAHYRAIAPDSPLSGTQIVARAKENADSPAAQAMREFAISLGGVVGDMARAYLPMGGIFLTGGAARAAAPWTTEPGFAGAMRGDGVLAPMIGGLGVDVVSDDFAGLLGCLAVLGT